MGKEDKSGQGLNHQVQNWPSLLAACGTRYRTNLATTETLSPTPNRLTGAEHTTQSEVLYPAITDDLYRFWGRRAAIGAKLGTTHPFFFCRGCHLPSAAFRNVASMGGGAGEGFEPNSGVNIRTTAEPDPVYRRRKGLHIKLTRGPAAHAFT